MWAGAYDGPHAALVQSLLGSGDAKTLAKGTCEGLGGGVTVIKKAGCGSSASGFTADGCVTDGGEAGYTALEGALGFGSGSEICCSADGGEAGCAALRMPPP